MSESAKAMLTITIDRYKRLSLAVLNRDTVIKELEDILEYLIDLNPTEPDLSEVEDLLGEGEAEDLTEHMSKAFEVAAEMKRNIMEARRLPGKCTFKEKCIAIYLREEI